jgi:hypothetical protein
MAGKSPAMTTNWPLAEGGVRVSKNVIAAILEGVERQGYAFVAVGTALRASPTLTAIGSRFGSPLLVPHRQLIDEAFPEKP